MKIGSEKITKFALVTAVIAIAATAAVTVYYYPQHTQIFLTLLAVESFAAVFLVLSFLSNSEAHYFVVIDEAGKPIALKKKRLKKSFRITEVVELNGFKFEINPVNKIHLVTNFGETEAEIILDVEKAKAEAKMRERKATMLDLTVQALSKLFTEQNLLLLLIIITAALSAGNLILTLLLAQGGG